MELNLKVPDKLIEVFSSDARYKILYGGRVGAKSWTFSDLAILRGYQEPKFIPCLRQYQVSIRDSVQKLLAQSIIKLNLERFYEIQDKRIIGTNGTEIIFKGLARNINNLKSLEGADIVWVTEGVDVSEEAWKKLIPTIRKKGSEIWVDFNPEEEDDPTYKRFVTNPPQDSLVINVNYTDNPFFPEVSRQEMEYDREFNPDEFNNIWLGECKKVSEAQIMKGKWEIKEFDTPQGVYFRYGADWGNSGLGDPDVIIRCFEQDGYLYIDEEAGDNVKEIEDYVDFYDSMKGSRENKIICDNTMEKFRKYLANKGFYLENARKGQGSIDAGIKFLRSYKAIYIHPRCKGTIYEFKNYKYKTDPKTGEVLNIIIDKHNHYIDSLRYSVENIHNTGHVTTTTGW